MTTHNRSGSGPNHGADEVLPEAVAVALRQGLEEVERGEMWTTEELFEQLKQSRTARRQLR